MRVVVGCITLLYNRPLKPGQKMPSHKHPFPHTVICVKGKGIARVETGEDTNEWREYPLDPFCALDVPKRCRHEIVGVEGELLTLCVHPHWDDDGKMVERFVGNLWATQPCASS